MKLAIVTAMWKRPEIFRLFALGVLDLKHPDIEFNVVVAGSEKNVSANLARSFGFEYVEHPNSPLSKKHNIACRYAKKHKPDYVLFLGSDDILNPDILNVYYQQMKKGTEFIGITDFYFYDVVSKKAAYWGGYIDQRKGHTVGAGRMVKYRLMDEWGFAPFETRLSHVLDDSMQRKLKSAKSIYTFSLKDTGTYGIDIKSSVNMTPFKLWPNTKYIDSGILDNFSCLKELSR